VFIRLTAIQKEHISQASHVAQNEREMVITTTLSQGREGRDWKKVSGEYEDD
jgi:hypothetical protein